MKVSDTVLLFEADLHLLFTLSGLEIGSVTVFSFKGIEFQSFTLATTIGALTVKDTFVFAPSIVEIEIVLDPVTLEDTYCVNASDPFLGFFFRCPTPDNLLKILLDPGYEVLLSESINFFFTEFHEAYATFYKAIIFDAHGMMDQILTFRKKVVELSLNIAGLTLSTRAMFANVGTPTASNYLVGIVGAVEGQTVSGIVVRGETYIGARQGEECFAECKPDEILHGGKVVPDFTIQQEKLFIRNLVLAGVNIDAKIEFQFFNNPGAVCSQPGFCLVEIIARGRVTPLNLTFVNELRLGPDLNPRYDELTTTLRFGDIAVTLEWVFFPSQPNCGAGALGTQCGFDAQLAEIILAFDPPGVSIVDEITFCVERLFQSGAFAGTGACSPQNGVFRHELYISTKVANFTFDAELNFDGLMAGFREADISVVWTAGNVDFEIDAIIFTNAVAVIEFTMGIKF
jgi:hypothetical protein